MLIWKQGQFYPELGKKIVELPNEVYPGPSDAMIKIDGFNVQPDENGDFIHSSNGIAYTEDELDAINTYAVIRMVINMYEDLLGKPIQWSWWENGKEEPLLVKIRINDINARFIKECKCIELDYYGPFNNWVYNCRSVDLIAHETGHAILDSILPHLNKGSVESRGIGEAFCDLTAMFWILSQKDLCDHIVLDTQGDLTKTNILSLFGLGYGHNKNQFRELRNAINDIYYKKDQLMVYDFGQILVGVFYEILCNLHYSKHNIITNSSQNLYQLGQKWKKTIFEIYLKLNTRIINLNNVAFLIINAFENENIDVKKLFKRRKIF